MSGDTVLQKKMIVIILSISLAFLGIFSLISIEKLQGNARVINYAGVVRGATQRLVKEEMYGQADDKLIIRLDNIIDELMTGEGDLGLIRLNDNTFQSLMTEMKAEWQELKKEIMAVRQGADDEKLFRMSQEYFELADQTVAEAEAYSAKNVRIAEVCFMVLAAVFIIIAGLLIWLRSIQNKRQNALLKAENENKEKREHLTQMEKELQAPINEISELIYVSDIESYDLLFVNEAGRQTFHLDDIRGVKCYEAIQGRKDPCPFCTNDYLKPDENYNWEITNPLTKRHYMLKDRLIEWEGKKARMEIAFDMTLIENEKQKIQYALDVENMIMECIRVLYQGRNLNQDINQVLKQLGTFLHAERAYIFSLKDGFFYNDFEWCDSNVDSVKNSLQGVPLSIFSRWLPIFEKQQCMVIENLEDYKETSPEEYDALSVQGIQSLVVAPMESGGVLTGCLGVDNPPAGKLWNIGSPLQTLCYFIMLAFRRADNERQLSHLSFHDTLTSFYNRNRFMKDLQTLVNEQVSVGIVYLDVNGLKEVNDSLGHAEGDKMLIRAANKIRAVFRQSDSYRVGGDEFVIVCRDITSDKFEEKVKELKRSFEQDSRCNAAIGSRWAHAFQNVNQIVADADARMYEDKKEFYRKNRKVNRYRYHSDEILQLANPEILKEEIERQQFVVYLQPKISSADRTAVGAEALIRYRSKDGSLVLPGNFLPVLEEAKSISQIDFYVFEFVCSKIKTWSKEGKKEFPISVNFSRYSLMEPEFIKRLKQICEKYQISPAYMEIEITERAGDMPEVDMGSLIAGLRREGFGVTIDDFGTDYANLALLSAVEFDVLKLDISMVKDVADNPKTQAIIQSIMEICNKMNIKLVAEGIESEEQLEALKSCGVQLVQGFLFSEPISIEEYEKQYL